MFQFSIWHHDRYICEFIVANDLIEAIEFLRNSQYHHLFFVGNHERARMHHSVITAKVIEDWSQK